MSVCKLTVAGLCAQAATTAALAIISVTTGAGLPFYLLAAANGLTGLFFLLTYTRVLAPASGSAAALEPVGQVIVLTASGASQAETSHEELLDALPAAILDIDMDKRVTYANEAALALFGCHPSDMKGRLLSSFIAEECLDEAEDLVQRALSGGITDARELRIVLDDGAARSIGATIAPIWNERNIAGCRCVAIEINRSKELAAALQEARQASDEATARLEKAKRDLEEFAMIAIRREVKMREIRERLHGRDSSSRREPEI